MNSDSMPSSRNGGTARNNLTALTGLGTAQTIFTMNADNGTPVNAFVSVPLGTEIYGANSPLDPNANNTFSANVGGMMTDYRNMRGVPYFTSATFSGRPFNIQMSGLATTSASSNNITITLAQNTTAVLASANNLIAATAVATSILAAGSYSWMVQATCIWDSVGQVLNGIVQAVVGNASAGVHTQAAFNNISVTTLAGLLFIGSVTFAAGAANTVTPVEFSISQI